jgi:hypothetical protein
MGSGPSPLSCVVFLPPPLLQAFLLLVAGWSLPLMPSPAGVFIYSSRGKWAFLPSCGVFLPSPLLQTFLLLVAGWVPLLLLPSLAGLFIYSSVGDCPSPPLRLSGHPALLAMCLFCCYYSVSLFSLGGDWSVQGAMLIWPRVVCGSTVCCLAYLVVCIFPSGLGTGILQCRSPSGFSI